MRVQDLKKNVRVITPGHNIYVVGEVLVLEPHERVSVELRPVGANYEFKNVFTFREVASWQEFQPIDLDHV